MLSLNSMNVDFTDYYDIDGDSFEVVKDTEDENNFCLLRKREGTYTVIGFGTESEMNNKMKKRLERITNV